MTPDRYIVRDLDGFLIDFRDRSGRGGVPVREFIVVDSLYAFRVVWRSPVITARQRVPEWRERARVACDELNAWSEEMMLQ